MWVVARSDKNVLQAKKTHLSKNQCLRCISQIKYEVEGESTLSKQNNGVVEKHVPSVVLLFDSTSRGLLKVATYMPVLKCIMCVYSLL